MERVDQEGMVATAETMAKIISSCINTVVPTIHIYDIHALPIRFYFTNNVIVKLESAIPLLKQQINSNSIIVFPDDGAHKRFKHYFKDYKIIICAKVREGNFRKIRIVDKINFPKDEQNLNYSELIIVDDLVQSGGTLEACRKALEEFGYVRISAYVTHSVFPNKTYTKIIKSNFYNFYTTNTIPEVTDLIKNFKPFKIIQIFGNLEYKYQIIYVSSKNLQKLEAVYNSFSEKYPNKHFIVKGCDINSEVPEQPVGKDQTFFGASNRLENMKKLIQGNFYVSLENGVFNKDDHYFDYCCAIVCKNNNIKIADSDTVEFPQKYFEICERLEQKITVGQLIQNDTGIPKDNWHQHFNENKLTRVNIMSKCLNKIYF